MKQTKITVDPEHPFHEVAGIMPMMKGEPFDRLCEDIRENGLQVPIVVHHNGKIIDGRNRFRACDSVGVEPIYKRWSGKEGEEVAYVLSLNLARRHLNESQRAMVAARLAQLRHGANQHREDAPIGASSTQPDAAKSLNVSRRSVQRARAVAESCAPEVVDAVEQGEIAVAQAVKLSKATPEVQKEVVAKVRQGVKPTEAHRQVTAERIEERRIEEPTGKYRVIYADPPWSYGNSMPPGTTTPQDHYPTMSTPDICALPVKALAEDNAVLFMWTTSPLLEESFSVIKAWGFKYKTSFIWDKVKHNMGHYNSVRHELLLVCTRGSCQPDVRKLFDSVVTEERTEHSAKPKVFYEIIDTIYPAGARVELFARVSRDGWERWGYEAPGE